MSIEVSTGSALRLEVAGRELTGPLGGEARQPGWARWLLGVPAALLLALLIVPMGWTLAWAVGGDVPVFGNFAAVLTDEEALRAALHSLVWVGIAVLLLIVGYGIAVLSGMVGGLWRVLVFALILPFGVSAVVSGAVFRIIFDPNPERGLASALFGAGPTFLGPGLIWWVLASAFAWSWLGFVVVLFRAGLDSTRRDPRHRLPRPGPVTATVVLTVLVAAIRVFDLVLIAVPGSVQEDVNVVGLHWWRLTSRSGVDTGGPAALAVLLFAVVAAISLAGLRSMRRPTTPAAMRTSDHSIEKSTSDGQPRWWARVAGVGVGLLWLAPVGVLVATAAHQPEVAGAIGFWHLDGLGFGSFTTIGETWLWPALAGSLLIAGLATALVLAASVPAAYLLTWVLPAGRPRLARALTVLLVVLAVAPVQMYAGPLDHALAGLGLAGSRAPIALVHAAAGVPFATLVLRAAFLAAPRSSVDDARPALDTMWRRGRYRPALIAVVVLEFVLVWNDFIVGFLIGGPGTSPVTLLLWGEARQFGTSAGTVAAGAVVSAVIPVAILLATWRKVVAGLTGGIAT